MSLTNATPLHAAQQARLSSRLLATLPVAQRNAALSAIHDALSAAREEILAANARDVEAAQRATAEGELNPSILKRLDLSRPGKFEDMLMGIRDVEALGDPGGFFPLLFSFSSLLLFLVREKGCLGMDRRVLGSRVVEEGRD
jgi:glutamate-5-semialdehyde dehydrogenase